MPAVRRMSILAFVSDRRSISRILEHLGLPSPEQDRPPPAREIHEITRVAEQGEGCPWTATATGILRVVADEHYFTDVAAGAAAGALVGYLVPRLNRPEPAPQGAASVRLERPPTLVSLPLRLRGLAGQGAVRAGVGSGFGLEASWHW